MTRAKTFIVTVCCIGVVCFLLYDNFDFPQHFKAELVGGHYCTYVPDPECFPELPGWPKCCADPAHECPTERPPCEISQHSKPIDEDKTKFYCLGEPPRTTCFFENVCFGNFKLRSKMRGESWEEIPSHLELSLTTDGERFKKHVMHVGEWANRYLRRAIETDHFEGSALVFSIGLWPHLYPHVWTNNLNHLFNISSKYFGRNETLDFYIARTGKASHPYIEWPPKKMRDFLTRIFNYRQSFYFDDHNYFETLGVETKHKKRTRAPEICYNKLSVGMSHIGWHDSLFTNYDDVIAFYQELIYRDCPKQEYDGDLPVVIVVNRTQTKNDGKCKRCFKNYLDIDLVLSSMDDIIYYAGAHDFVDFSIQEQICLVRNASFLIGFHGAGLINAQWMQKRPGWVLEVRFPTRTGAWFGRTTGEFNMHHTELPWENTCAIEVAIRANLQGDPNCPTTKRFRQEGKLTFPDRFEKEGKLILPGSQASD